MPWPNWRRLFWHAARRAASRARVTAGSNSATRMPMMAITTSSSTSVKPRRRKFCIERVINFSPADLQISVARSRWISDNTGCTWCGLRAATGDSPGRRSSRPNLLTNDQFITVPPGAAAFQACFGNPPFLSRLSKSIRRRPLPKPASGAASEAPPSPRKFPPDSEG